MSSNNKNKYKSFLIKLSAITIAVIIVINVSYNLLIADKIEMINKVLLLSNKETIDNFKVKIRSEIKDGLSKEKILTDEDAKILYRFYSKIKKELLSAENN